MTFDEYLKLAPRTCKELPAIKHIEHMAMGVVGEFGEIIDAIKKSEIYGKELDKVNLTEEVGDALWYVACLIDVFGLPEKAATFEELEAQEQPDKLAVARKSIVASLMFVCSTVSGIADELTQIAEQSRQNSENLNVDTLKDGGAALLILIYGTARILDVDIYEAMDRNIAKLAKRYGDKYSDYSALNRDLDGERKLLEGQA